MEECTICSLVAGMIKSYIVYEDENLIAFLDIRPIFLGHCLVAPKKHFKTFYDLPKALLKIYFQAIQRIGKAIEVSMEAKGSFIAINNNVSQSIPHLHTHIVPRNPKDGLKGFFWPRMKYEDDKQQQIIQSLIKQQLDLSE